MVFVQSLKLYFNTDKRFICLYLLHDILANMEEQMTHQISIRKTKETAILFIP